MATRSAPLPHGNFSIFRFGAAPVRIGEFTRCVIPGMMARDGPCNLPCQPRFASGLIHDLQAPIAAVQTFYQGFDPPDFDLSDFDLAE
jgi:hypothetical protein